MSQLSDQDLYDPEGMAAIIGQPVAPLICGIYEHYEEHAQEFERLSAEAIIVDRLLPNSRQHTPLGGKCKTG